MFAEVEVPIFDTLAVKAAVRHEEFTDQGLDATVPKISARYEITPELALRASWGESFLAPTSFQTRPARTNENCGDMYSGADDLSGTLLLGGLKCQSGNPNLGQSRPKSQTLDSLGSLKGSMDLSCLLTTRRLRTLIVYEPK